MAFLIFMHDVQTRRINSMRLASRVHTPRYRIFFFLLPKLRQIQRFKADGDLLVHRADAAAAAAAGRRVATDTGTQRTDRTSFCRDVRRCAARKKTASSDDRLAVLVLTLTSTRDILRRSNRGVGGVRYLPSAALSSFVSFSLVASLLLKSRVLCFVLRLRSPHTVLKTNA